MQNGGRQLGAGDLDRRVEVQTRTLARSSDGGWQPIYSTWRTVWAKVDEVSGNEVQVGSGTVTRKSLRVTTRWIDGIDAKARVRWGDRIFAASSVVVTEGRRRFVEIVATETAAAGDT